MNFLVAGSQHQTDCSLSQSLKPDRGMPSLFTGAGLFLEREVFVPASLKIDLSKQDGSRSPQSRTWSLPCTWSLFQLIWHKLPSPTWHPASFSISVDRSFLCQWIFTLKPWNTD